jgi:hypothetical protein
MKKTADSVGDLRAEEKDKKMERAKGFESVRGVLVRAMRCKYMPVEAR